MICSMMKAARSARQAAAILVTLKPADSVAAKTLLEILKGNDQQAIAVALHAVGGLGRRRRPCRCW